MPVKIHTPSGATMGTADKDYFLNKDGELAEGEADAATLLIRAGQEVPREMAEKYGLGKDNQVASEGEAAAEEEKAAEPSQNKSAKPTKNKGVK